MAKTVADMTPQELIKMLTASFGALIDARIKTAEVTIKANTDASIKAAEERIKTELRAELASKKDIKRLEEKLDRQDERITALEEHTGIAHKN